MALFLLHFFFFWVILALTKTKREKIMLTKKQENKLSTMLCFFLRHSPEKAQIQLDQEGWTDVSILIDNINSHCKKQIHRHGVEIFTLEHLQFILGNDIKRYSHTVDWSFVRCTQGHSHPSVDIEFDTVVPDHDLYHGTSPAYIDSIMKNGLLPQTRHYVHLSKDIKTAINVGKRHSKQEKPIILVVKKDAPVSFFITENGVFHATHVPPEHLTILEY